MSLCSLGALGMWLSLMVGMCSLPTCMLLMARLVGRSLCCFLAGSSYLSGVLRIRLSILLPGRPSLSLSTAFMSVGLLQSSSALGLASTTFIILGASVWSVVGRAMLPLLIISS